MARPGLTASVVVPTYRRPAELAACLDGIGRLDPAPDQVVVVHRPDDRATVDLLRGRTDLGLVVAQAASPGQVAALAAGARRATGAIVAFTDDDAVPRPDWLGRLLDAYRGTDVGAAGGRDVVHHGASIDDGSARTVGIVTAWGHVIGGHHHGVGSRRDVDHLKGANMSIRRDLLAIPRGLRGQGAEVRNDLAFTLSVRRRGWRVVYDPHAVVDHWPAARFDADRRETPRRRALEDGLFNESYVLYGLDPRLRWRRPAWGLVVGDRAGPGLVRTAYAVACRDWSTARRFMPAQRMTLEAWRASRSQGLVMEPL